jgi:predicted alpha-1,2-mannosidase
MIHEMIEMQAANMGQYAHGNQPIQHLPYLYSYAGQPWKTQYWVRQIMDRLYNSTPQGFPGDEDQGGMSAWYVLSALGLYAVTPGTDQYVIGSPLFSRVTLTTESGKKFVIEARGNSSENVYIQQGTLNGVPLERNYLTYGEIVNGGYLQFTMGPQPNKQRNISKSASPFSQSKPIVRN